MMRFKLTRTRAHGATAPLYQARQRHAKRIARLIKIHRILQDDEGIVKIKTLARWLRTSEETIRRDVVTLEYLYEILGSSKLDSQA